MSIPSQLPQLVTAARTGALQALALQAGQSIDARIVGVAPNGGTQVEIRGQMLNLLLPMAVQAGQTLTFQVQGSGPQQRLTLPPPAVASTPAPVPATSPPVPQGAAAVPQPVNPIPNSAPPQVLPSPPGAVVAQATSATPPQPVLSATPYGPPSATMVASNPAATAAAATAPATPPAAQPMPGGIQPVAPGSSGSGLSNQPPPAQPATPHAALAQMVQAAVPRQGAVTNLTAALTAIAGRVALPEPVLRAAQQVMAGRVAIDGARFDGAILQNAVRSSGVFQEAALARGQMPLPQADMKSALLALRQTLTRWLGQQAPVTPVAHIAPPLKGSVPRARASEPPPPLDPDDGPEAIGKQLLERTDSALARVRLHQHASLPEPLGRTGDWSLDLPVLVGTQQTLMQIQIHRDQSKEGAEAGERGWQLRFALNLPGLGEVGAQVSLRAGATGVMLWATEPATSAALEADLALLRDGLISAGLNPSAVIVRHGAPPAPPPAPSGHFVDART